MLSHVKSKPLVRGEELAAHVASELEEVDVLLLAMLVVHRLRRETPLTHVAGIHTEKIGYLHDITGGEQICSKSERNRTADKNLQL